MRKVEMNEVHAVKDINILKSIPSLLTKHYGEQMADIWEFGINVAIRISDTLNIKITDIENGRLKVTESKTGKVADISLNDKAMTIVNKIKSKHTDAIYLFQSRSSRNVTSRTKSLSRQAVTIAFKGIGDIIGVKLGTHSMRKTRGYHLYKKTNDITRVAAMLRHSSTAVTMRYIGITQDDIDNDFNELVL
tara:strand:+ start:4606 stop:5178 length:573 start_codon:yes stop_codon:yes gene_type:complete